MLQPPFVIPDLPVAPAGAGGAAFDGFTQRVGKIIAVACGGLVVGPAVQVGIVRRFQVLALDPLQQLFRFIGMVGIDNLELPFFTYCQPRVRYAGQRRIGFVAQARAHDRRIALQAYWVNG
ncbi:hypothetical protein D3C76_488870 [compost metagenome]